MYTKSAVSMPHFSVCLLHYQIKFNEQQGLKSFLQVAKSILWG